MTTITATRESSVPPTVRGEPVVVAHGAAKVFPSGDGVHELDLIVPSGSIFGFIGPSGSGKTTTVRMLTGLVRPSAGTISVMGANPVEFDGAARARLGYMPQLSVLYSNLSVDANLRFFASLYGISARAGRERRAEVLEFVELAGHEHKRVTEISGGMQRRLSLAAALVHRPTLLFLDEPTAGIDPVLRRRFWDHFGHLRDDGRTLFVTTQYVGEAAYCDLVGVLADGRLLLVAPPDGLRRAAFGGDIITVELARAPSEALRKDIQRILGASSCEQSSLRGLRIVVDEAAVALPELTAWLSSQHVEITQAEEYLPPFDDVFVELLERYRDIGADAPAGRE